MSKDSTEVILWHLFAYLSKQKEGEAYKAGEFNASTGWFDNFIKKFGLKNVKTTREPRNNRQVFKNH